MPPSKEWKARERKVAALFDAKRNALSGSNSGVTASDSRHPKLFLETKLRKRCFVVSLWKKTKELAAKESKFPVLALCEGGKPGAIICVHSSHLEAFAEEVIRILDAREAAAAPPPPKKKKKTKRKPSFLETPAGQASIRKHCIKP